MTSDWNLTNMLAVSVFSIEMDELSSALKLDQLVDLFLCSPASACLYLSYSESEKNSSSGLVMLVQIAGTYSVYMDNLMATLLDFSISIFSKPIQLDIGTLVIFSIFKVCIFSGYMSEAGTCSLYSCPNKVMV